MRKLILTIGLPRSGKSTWAKSTGLPIVNRDSIRLALYAQPFIPEAEDMVTAIETYMAKALILVHETVIIDATHIKEEYRKRWTEDDFYDKVEYKIFNTSAKECIRRAKKDGKEYLIPVIKRMNGENLRQILRKIKG